jgi:putative oxidoreductase
MSFGENIAPLVGRCMIAAFFVLSGLQKVQNWDSTTLYMAEHGISAIQPLLALSIVVEAGAGLGIAIGFRTRLLALVLFAYTLIVSFQMHDFWTMAGSDASRVEAALFAKNMAIAGGLLVLVGLGAGRWSYDSRREE